MNGPYNVQYKRENLERQKLLERVRLTLVGAVALGLSFLLINGFSASTPTKARSMVPLETAPEMRTGGSPPAWLKEYSHPRSLRDEQESKPLREALATPEAGPASNEETHLDANLKRVTPIQADRKALDKALRLAGEK